MRCCTSLQLKYYQRYGKKRESINLMIFGFLYRKVAIFYKIWFLPKLIFLGFLSYLRHFLSYRAQLSTALARKQKMSQKNDFSNFFSLVYGQLKSKRRKKSRELFLRKADFKVSTLYS